MWGNVYLIFLWLIYCSCSGWRPRSAIRRRGSTVETPLLLVLRTWTYQESDSYIRSSIRVSSPVIAMHRQQATGKKFKYLGLSFINWISGCILLLMAISPCSLHAKEVRKMVVHFMKKRGEIRTLMEGVWLMAAQSGWLRCLPSHSFVDKWVQVCQEGCFT